MKKQSANLFVSLTNVLFRIFYIATNLFVSLTNSYFQEVPMEISYSIFSSTFIQTCFITSTCSQKFLHSFDSYSFWNRASFGNDSDLLYCNVMEGQENCWALLLDLKVSISGLHFLHLNFLLFLLVWKSFSLKCWEQNSSYPILSNTRINWKSMHW